MRFIGVDPGANFTGVAVLHASGPFVFNGETADPVQAWRWIYHYCDLNADEEDRVILEDFVGGGQRDANVTKTIKAVGYIEYRCREYGITVELVNPQARLANVKNVPRDITGKDEVAAAAHALSARERYKSAGLPDDKSEPQLRDGSSLVSNRW